MYLTPRTFGASLCASLLFATSLLTGCSNLAPVPSVNSPSVNGNWQITATAATAPKLSSLSGELTGTAASMIGIFHSKSSSACVSPSTSFDVAGSTNAAGLTTLKGALAGGTLTLTGNLDTSGKILKNAMYSVSGGACALAAAVPATATVYAPITGNYSGSFQDADGQVITVTASLSQSPASDANGNFTLSGTGTFPSNPCFNSPVSVSNTQVTGGNFTLTYTDPSTTNSVVVTGTFPPAGTSLNVTNWTLTGPCGPDSGTGTLTKQP